MSRKLRYREINTIYYVYSRCHENRSFLENNRYKELFLNILTRTQQKYNFCLLDYAILDNNIHLVIKTLPLSADISRIMQYIKSRIAEAYNSITGKIGAFWNERFKDKVMSTHGSNHEDELSVKFSIATAPGLAGITDDPLSYRFSAMRIYLSGIQDKQGPFITFMQSFIELGQNQQQRASNLMNFFTTKF